MLSYARYRNTEAFCRVSGLGRPSEEPLRCAKLSSPFHLFPSTVWLFTQTVGKDHLVRLKWRDVCVIEIKKKNIYFFTNIINKYFCWKLWLKWKCLVKCEKNKYIDNDIKLTLEGLPYSLRWMQPWYCLPIGENHQSRYVRVVICSLTCKLIISLQRKRSPGFPCPFSK